LQPGDLIIIAARPSMGKTTLALNIASHASAEAKERVGSVIFSLEMGKEQLVMRFLSSLARVDARTDAYRPFSGQRLAKLHGLPASCTTPISLLTTPRPSAYWN
jgi:replicative DNA helicase